MYQAGLVLEGGGMKGMYTAGVLDFFMEKEIAFSDNYGVSAGRTHSNPKSVNSLYNMFMFVS